MIHFRCPHCDRAIRIHDDAAGREGKCHGCDRMICVPAVQLQHDAGMNIGDQTRVVFWGIAGTLLGGLIAVVRIAGANALVGGGILNDSAVFWGIVAMPAMIGGAFGLLVGILMVLVSRKPQ